MNQSTKWIVGVIVVVAVVVVGYFVPKGPSGPVLTEPIKIGFIGPLTGDAANIGQNVRTAVEISVKEVNETGGIDGRPLEVIYEDGQCTGNVASNAANKLISINKVPLILGGACSGETSSFMGAAEQSKTVVLSYCSSAPAISQAGDYIFRNYSSDLYQGSFAAEYIYNKLGKKKIAILYGKSSWGNGVKDVFVQRFNELGGTIIATEGYEQTSRDLRTQLTKIKSVNPELVYFLGYTEASIPGMKQAREIGLDVSFFGGDVWDDSKIWTDVGSAGEGAMYSVVYAPLNSDFKAKMKNSVGSDEITICTPQAYDAVKLIAKVIEKVGTDAEAIKNELYKTSYTGGVSASEITFDSNGDPVGANFIVKVVRNGEAIEAK